MKNFSNWAQPIASAILAAALVMLGLNLYVVPQIAELQAEGRGAAGTTQFTSAVRFREAVTAERDLTVTGALTAATVSATTSATIGALSATTLAVSGASTFATNPILPSESITPTDGGSLTLAAGLVTLTPGGAVGVSLAACSTGAQVVVYNSLNANVVITDTGNFIGAGNQTLGQFDALGLACIATKWVQISAVSAN